MSFDPAAGLPRDIPQSRVDLRRALQDKLNGKAKPIGSLGRLEELAIKIGEIKGSLTPQLGKAAIAVFAGDHGLTAEGVTAYPSEVTAAIAQLVLAGQAGVSVLARAAAVDVVLIDCGIAHALEAHPRLLAHRIGNGTRNSRCEAALSEAECRQALAAGQAVCAKLSAGGCDTVGYGEVGIGNSSAASLIAHTLTGISLDVLAGPGAGAPPLGLDHKREVLKAAVSRACIADADPAARAFSALREFGGFEIAVMAGAMNAAAAAGHVIVVDGFISTAAMLAANGLVPGTVDNAIFAHCSAEPGHRAVLAHLGVKPLLELDMRLGEGTGAALAIPVIRAAAALLTDMADLPGEHPL